MNFDLTRKLMMECQQKGERRMLMLCLAFHTDEEGICWPSQQTLAQEANLSERGVQKMMDGLIAEGEIELLEKGNGRGKTSKYRLTRYLEKGERSVPPLEDKGRTIGSSFTIPERANVETQKGEPEAIKGERNGLKGEQAVPPKIEDRVSSGVSSLLTADWISKTSAMDCYRGLDVPAEVQKAKAWYGDEPLTPRRMFSWLNKAPKTPMKTHTNPNGFKLRKNDIPGQWTGPDPLTAFAKAMEEGE